MKYITFIISLATFVTQGFISSAQCTLKAHAGRDTLICISNPVILGSSTIYSGGNTGTYKYVWLPINDSTQTNPVVSPTVTTSYVLKVKNGSCTVYDTVVITVKTLPTITLNLPANFCYLNSVTFSAKATAKPSAIYTSGGGTISKYSWSFTGASVITSTLAEPSKISFTKVGIDTIYASATNECGTTTTQNAVTVDTVPTVSVTPSTGVKVCQNDSVLVCGSGSGTIAPYFTRWTTNGQSNNLFEHPNNTSCTELFGNQVTNGIFNLTFTVTDGHGCVASRVIKDTVMLVPALSVVANPSNYQFCAGVGMTLTGQGASSYSWTPNNHISSTTTSTVSVNPPFSTNYIITGYGTNGCSMSLTEGVVVVQLPIPYVTATSLTLCKGSQMTLTPTGATTYSWKPDPTLAPVHGSFNAVISPTVTTTYTLYGTDGYGCSDSNSIVISVIPPPPIYATSSKDTFCAGSGDTLRGFNAQTYCWKPATALSSTSSATVIATPTVTTTYTMKGNDGPNCYLFDTLVVHVYATTAKVTTTSAICPGETTSTLTASNITNPTWSPAIGLSATTGSVVIANPTDTTTYYVTGHDAGSCVVRLPSLVITYPIPIVPDTSVGYCSGLIATLYGRGAATYTWSPSIGLSATTGDSVYTTSTVNNTYIVTGTNIYGCYDTGFIKTTVFPLPVINAVASPYSLCLNQSSVLSTTTQKATTYTWSPATGLNGTNAATVTATPPYTIIYTLTATSSHTCVSTDTAIVTVFPLPVIIITPDNIGTCIGTSITASVTGAASYSWSPTVGNSNSNGSLVTLSPTITTTYTVIATDTQGCKGFYTDLLTIYPLPTVFAGNDTGICNNTAIQFTHATPKGGVWSGFNISSSGLFNAAGITPGYFRLTYTYTSIYGCTDTSSLLVHVVTTPIVTVSHGFNICQNTTPYTLKGTPTGGTWTGNGITGSVFYPAHAPAGLNILTYTYTNGYCVLTDTIQMTVRALPIAGFTVSSPGNCSPAYVTFNNTSTNIDSFRLYTNGWATHSSPYSTQLYTGSKDSTYIVKLIAINRCATDTITHTIQVVPATVNKSFTVSDTVGCVPFTVTLTNNSTGQTYASLGILHDTVTTANTLKYTFKKAGIYHAYVYLQNNCTFDTAYVTIHVRAFPHIAFIPSADSVCANTLIKFNNTSSGAITYVWNLGDGDTSHAVSPSHSYTSSGNFIVTLTGTGAGVGCVSDTSISTNIYPAPQQTITANAVKGCQPFHLVLHDSALFATSFLWNFPDTTTSTLQNPTHTLYYPPHRDTVFCTATNSKGCTSKAFIIVKVYPNAAAHFTLSDSSSCNYPDTVLTTNTSTGAHRYLWYFGNGDTSNLATPTIIYTGQGQYLIKLIAHNNACADTISFLYVGKPPAVITASATKHTICFNDTTTLSATGGAIANYKWYPAMALSSTTGTPVIAQPTATTTYTLRGADIHGCRGTDTVRIVVHPLPIVSTNPSSYTAICYNKYISITATGAKKYLWLPGNDTSATINISPQSTTIYTVIGSDNNGCVNTDTQKVVVYPLPIVTSSVTKSVICRGDSITLFASGAISYKWQPGNDSINPWHLYPLDTTTYIVTGKDIHGCTNVDSQTVIVHHVPTVSISPSTYAMCIGTGNVTLTASGAVNYIWQPGNNNTSSITVSPTITTIYTVTGTNQYACVNKDSLTFTIYPLPVISINTPQNYICKGYPVLLTASGALSYRWRPHQGLSDTIRATTLANPTTTTRYTVWGTDIHHCVDTSSINIAVYPAQIILNKYSSKICKWDTTQLIAHNALSYAWYPAARLTNINDSTFTASPLTTTTYTVVGTDAHGCHDTVNTTVVVDIPRIYTNNNAVAACQRSKVDLQVFGGLHYVWFPTSGITPDTGSTVTANVTTNMTYNAVGYDAMGCADTVTITLTAEPLPTIKYSVNDSAGCTPLSVTFTNLSSNTEHILWFFGDSYFSSASNPTHLYYDTGTFAPIIIAKSIYACTDTLYAHDSIRIYTRPIPYFTYKQNAVPYYTNEVQFTDSSQHVLDYLWRFGDTTQEDNIPNPSHTFKEGGEHTVTLVTYNHACIDSVSKTFDILLFTSLYVPNALSPDRGAGEERYFLPKGVNVSTYHIQIYDTWGKLLWESDQLKDGTPANYWDGTLNGKPMPQNVYVWKIDATFKDGTVWQGMKQENGTISTSGYVTLLR